MLSAVSGSAATADLREGVKAPVDAEYPALETIYKNLHAHPELSFMEVKTAALLAGELRRLGFDVTERVDRNYFAIAPGSMPRPSVKLEPTAATTAWARSRARSWRKR